MSFIWGTAMSPTRLCSLTRYVLVTRSFAVVHLPARSTRRFLGFSARLVGPCRCRYEISSPVQVLDRLESLSAAPNTAKCIALHGGADRLRLDILTDFFKFAFNGDGDDGGSCIDGLYRPGSHALLMPMLMPLLMPQGA